MGIATSIFTDTGSSNPHFVSMQAISFANHRKPALCLAALDYTVCTVIGDGGLSVVAVGIVGVGSLDACGTGSAGEQVLVYVAVAGKQLRVIVRLSGFDQFDEQNIRTVVAVRVVCFVTLQISDLTDPTVLVVVVDVGKGFLEKLGPIEVGYISIIVENEGEFNCVIGSFCQNAAGNELPLIASIVGGDVFCFHLFCAVKQSHLNAETPRRVSITLILEVYQRHTRGLDPAAEAVAVACGTGNAYSLGVALGRGRTASDGERVAVQIGPTSRLGGTPAVTADGSCTDPTGCRSHIRIQKHIVSACCLCLLQLKLRKSGRAGCSQCAYSGRDGDGHFWAAAIGSGAGLRSVASS